MRDNDIPGTEADRPSTKVDPTGSGAFLAAKVAVVLASAGRPDLLEDAVVGLNHADDVDLCGVVSVPDEASLPKDRSVLCGWRVVVGVRGAAAQRNVGMDALDDNVDLVFFFDDDAVVRPDYLAVAARFFTDHPEVVGLTGRVLMDGKLTAEIPRNIAVEAIAESVSQDDLGGWSWTRELYGANFGYRRSAAPTLRFDGRLPLYSWLEDHDFARRLIPFGRLALVDDCVIVHRAAGSGGRTRHLRLGYSQVMNAVYLVCKGSFPIWLGVQQVARPMAKNVALSFAGPDRRWRRRRLRGNLLAVIDVVRGRITPERILHLETARSGS